MASLSVVAGFIDRFASEFRVDFNWHRFESEGWPVELIQVRSRDQLARDTRADCRTTVPAA